MRAEVKMSEDNDIDLKTAIERKDKNLANLLDERAIKLNKIANELKYEALFLQKLADVLKRKVITG